MANNRIRGWRRIAKYLDVHYRTAQRYEETLGLPIHRYPGKGPRRPVFAVRNELDAWMEINLPDCRKTHEPLNSEIAASILNRISKLSNLTLYRRDYRLRMELRKSIQGTRCNLECRYYVCNATEERVPFTLEVTVDVPDHGHVEELAFFADRKLVYVFHRPRVTEQGIAHSVYRGREILIEPNSSGVIYECRALWIINRADDDFWGTHMLLPTVGVTVDTKAPPDFKITRSYSTRELIMKGDHIDIAWSYRPRRNLKKSLLAPTR